LGNNVLALMFPGGKCLYTTRQTKAMTVGADAEALTCPAGKRWLVFWGFITNNSGQAININVEITDGTNIIGGILYQAAAANGATYGWPRNDTDEPAGGISCSAFPIPMEAGQVLNFRWAADAGKAGNSYWYAYILEV
jgi:hypothetical protein